RPPSVASRRETSTLHAQTASGCGALGQSLRGGQEVFGGPRGDVAVARSGAEPSVDRATTRATLVPRTSTPPADSGSTAQHCKTASTAESRSSLSQNPLIQDGSGGSTYASVVSAGERSATRSRRMQRLTRPDYARPPWSSRAGVAAISPTTLTRTRSELPGRQSS